MEKEKKYANLFGNNPNISLEERNRVASQLQKIGSLTFKVHTHEDGWLAICEEVKGLIAGNTNPRPSQSEIDSEIREAIYAAFDVKFDKSIEDVGFRTIRNPANKAYSLC
jgi:hypothetical protein